MMRQNRIPRKVSWTARAGVCGLTIALPSFTPGLAGDQIASPGKQGNAATAIRADGRHVSGFSAETGKVFWTFEAESLAEPAPQVNDGRVYFRGKELVVRCNELTLTGARVEVRRTQ